MKNYFLSLLIIFLIGLSVPCHASDIEEIMEESKQIEEIVKEIMTFSFTPSSQTLAEQKRAFFTDGGWSAFQKETNNLQNYVNKSKTVVIPDAAVTTSETNEAVLNITLLLQRGSKTQISHVVVSVHKTGSTKDKSLQFTDWKIAPLQSIDFSTLK